MHTSAVRTMKVQDSKSHPLCLSVSVLYGGGGLHKDELKVEAHALLSVLAFKFQYAIVQGWAKVPFPICETFSRQVEAEVVSNSRNKSHQTWEW